MHGAPCKFLLGEANADPLTTTPESLKCQFLDTQIFKSGTFVRVFGKATTTYPFSYLYPAGQSHTGTTSWQHQLPSKSHFTPSVRFSLPIPAEISRPTNSPRYPENGMFSPVFTGTRPSERTDFWRVHRGEGDNGTLNSEQYDNHKLCLKPFS